MAGTAIQRFLDSLGTYDHQQGMRLFDAAVKDAGTARSALLGILLNAANQHDENPVTPHAVPTAFSGLEAFSLAGWPASLPVIRFLALYSFTLRKRDWSPAALERLAGSVRVVPGAKLADALARAMGGGKPQEAAAVAVVLAKREGLPAAGNALVSASLGDVGRLQHNLALAVAYAETAEALGDPAGIVAVANGAFEVTSLAKEYAPPPLGSEETSPATPDLERLEQVLFEDDFDEVHAQLLGFASSEHPEEALKPLLVAACLEPGFLGHSLIAAHATRHALRRLSPPERGYLLWKFYRTLVSRFGSPEGLTLRSGSEVEPAAAVEALKASLKMKTPPVERTLRDALESGVPLEKVLQHVVYNWTHWTVGEKEHTLQYLNAAVQTAAFLGKEQAMVPLVTTLYRLPF